MTKTTGWMAATAAVVAVMGMGASSGDRADGPASRRDTHENLHAVLWMQSAAEYQAVARGLYHLAALQLDRALEDHRWTAIPEQAGRADLPTLAPAVILDADETVIDNSPEEGQRVLDRKGYEPALFRAWVNRQEAATVPGAADFLRYAASRGVEVFIVTNRKKDEHDATVATLRKRGVEIPTEHMLCLGEPAPTDDSGDKTGRRQFVASTHRVLLLVGDDLGDFVSLTPDPGSHRLDRTQRAAVVDRFSGYWEDRWIVLPNPAYGSWEHAFAASDITENDSEAEKDRKALAAQFAGVRGFQQ